MATARSFFTEEGLAAITEAVIAAEIKTSGEVRVYIENNCGENVLDRAADVFAKLELHKTKERNGVLFYLAVKDRQFAILGDKGINAKVPKDFWDNIKEHMLMNFKRAAFAEGLAEGIAMAAEKLHEHFPGTHTDINELANDVVFGDE